MHLRQATLADLQAIYAIRRAAILGIAADLMSPSACSAWADKRTPDHFAPRIEAGSVVIAEDESGAAIAWGSSRGPRIEGLYIHPTAGRRGVGRRLMAELERHIRQRGHDRVRLAASPNAVGFYKKLGYVALAKEGDNPAVSMAKDML